MQWLIRVFLLVGLLSCLEAQRLKCQKSTIKKYDCMASLEENYTLYWKLQGKKLCVTIEGKTSGWVGLCFPRTAGRMFPAASVIGWVKGNQEHVKPYYIEGYTVTSGNENHDVSLSGVTGSEEDGKTTIEFCIELNKEKLKTDVDPQKGTPINWAYGNTDDLVYHGKQRGSATIRFADKPDNDTPPSPLPPRPSRTRGRASRDD